MSGANASKVSPRDAAMLAIVRDSPGIWPAGFAYAAESRGIIRNNAGRPWRAQGAGRIGGRELARLQKLGLVRGGGSYGRAFELTRAGAEACAQHEPETSP